ncbi:hypothetical protein [Paenibacillus sp. MMO-177]|uniref:hypothetical protein n=1 Tax=Paenibacillus sp. MMO-177 TaxID=3081289 RepID=UPI003015ED92
MDNALRYQLSIVASSFSKDLDEDDEGFNQCKEALSAAAALAPLTTFESQNNAIDGVLYQFGWLLSKPSNKQTVVQHGLELREIFMKLNADPGDVDTTKRLSDFFSSLKT